MRACRITPLARVLLAADLLVLLGAGTAAIAGAAGRDSSCTIVRLTNRVLVPDTMRLGINLGGDTYYSGAALVKMRTRFNFEGTMFRQCHFGPGSDERTVATWFRPNDTWRRILTGGSYTILSGPGKGMTGTVLDIIDKPYRHEGQNKPFASFVLDKQIPTTPRIGRLGIMIDRDRTDLGSFRRLDGYWTARHNEIVLGDVPPGSFGKAALNLRGSAEDAHVRFGTHYQRYGQTNGTWQLRFWAKVRRNAPQLTVAADRRYGGKVSLTPGPQWRQYQETIVVDSVPEPTGPKENPHLLFVFTATGGDVLLDDVEIWMEGDQNPTAFRDDCVAALRRFRPGVLRKLQMGGSTVANTIAPPLQSFAYDSQHSARPGPYESANRDPYSLHEMYVLCEHLGCDPWYCLPGTITRKEMEQFVEYVGAPADVGLGRRRAELGHPQPWTEVFHHLHVEFGNEAWNNAGPYQCGGFDGPDYWNDLIRTGKSSPHYKRNIIFHAAGQAAYSGRNAMIMRDCPNADRFSVAPYIIHSISRSEVREQLTDDDKLFRWAFAWPIRRSRDPSGAMFQNSRLAQAASIELSIYEVNHHITHGDGPLEPRNRLVTSIGGGLNVANNMLMMLKEHHLRTQCLFSLAQHSYKAHGVGPVRLWGTALCMRSGQERFRPTFLACATANKVIGGDLVETVHSGAKPTFEATGVFSSQQGVQTLKGLPAIFSYGFVEGGRRGLILVSLDTVTARPIELQFDGNVAGAAAQSWLLTADNIAANNELESSQPQVQVRQQTITDFRSRWRYTLPPFSMLALSWKSK